MTLAIMTHRRLTKVVIKEHSKIYSCTLLSVIGLNVIAPPFLHTFISRKHKAFFYFVEYLIFQPGTTGKFSRKFFRWIRTLDLRISKVLYHCANTPALELSTSRYKLDQGCLYTNKTH
jgi:hypothetical protein